MHQGTRFQNKDIGSLFAWNQKRGDCVWVYVILFLTFCALKKKRAKQVMEEKKRLSRGFAGRNQFLDVLVKKKI